MSCAPKKELSEGDKKQKDQNIKIEVNVDHNLLVFEILNQSESPIYLFNADDIHIEKKMDDSWQKVRILNCPCGAPCAKPDEYKKLLSGKYYKITWNKQESWCGEKDYRGLEKTIRKDATNGLYRIRVLYGITIKNKKEKYKEFYIQ